MNTWSQVNSMLASWKQQGLSEPQIAVNLAYACLGWAYVFGARGEQCTPGNRRAYYNAKGKPTIKSKCKNFEGTGTCSGCKWYPKGTTLFFDCRGFTYWVFLKATGRKIMGSGATSQYNDDSNWDEKGPISQMPKDKVCCVFRQEGTTMEHTLIYDGNGYYIHDSSEVKKTAMNKYSATHYAIPKGLYSVKPQPEPKPGTAIVTGTSVALREGPTTSAKVLTRIATGTVVNIENLPSDWTYVSYGSKSGFMMSMYIAKNGENYKVTGKNVALRYGPSTTCSVITRIPTGNIVKSATVPSDWEYISYQSKVGFMMKQYLKE